MLELFILFIHVMIMIDGFSLGREINRDDVVFCLLVRTFMLLVFNPMVILYVFRRMGNGMILC